MPTHPSDLRITSTPEQRDEAVAACAQQVMSDQPGISKEQATAICIDKANKAMGTRQPLE